MSKAIYDLVDNLPKRNVTTMVLNALDFVAPGQWQNPTNFEQMIRDISQETDEKWIQKIGDRAVWLFNDKNQGYQKALWLYQTVDSADYALGAAALANKVGEKIGFLGFLNKLTPSNQKAQALDLSLKLVVEVVAFCQINGLPGDSIGDFVKALKEYEGEALMRMAALVCIDALIPFGADFILTVKSTLDNLTPKELSQNSAFSKVSKLIPGGNPAGQLQFIGTSFDAVQGWMTGFVGDRNLTQGKVMNNLQNFVEFSNDQLDYVAAFLDMSTNYFEHTGTQSIATRLIRRAMAEV
jgi:predicted metal-binding protein